MTHVRTTIRNDAVTAATGLATTGTNVYDSRVFPTDQAKLPCWLVYSGDEEIVRASTGGLYQRAMQLVFEGVARGTSDVDGTLDTMLEELETALTLSSLTGAKTLDIAEIETEFSDDGDAPYGRMAVSYVVTYHTNEGAPTTAL